MKILVISDLHVDFGKDPNLKIDPNLFDIAVVAGDIANHAKEVKRYMLKYKEKVIHNKPMIYVPGNHCRWSLSLTESNSILSQIPGYMNRNIFEFNGQRFLGCTLWYQIKDITSKKTWSDLFYIKDWENIQQEHEKDIQFLYENLRKGDVVVTHMLPSYEVVSPVYVGDLYNRFYVTELLNLIKEREPLLWIHGHSHEFIYKKVHNSFFLRNPFGYPKEKKDYTTNFIIVDTNSLDLGVWAH